MNKAWIALKKVNNLPDWISAFSSFSFFLISCYGLFGTHLPELLISNLNQEISSLKKERLELSAYNNSLQSERHNSIALNNELNEKNRELIIAHNSYLEKLSPLITREFSKLLQTVLDEKLDCLEKLIRLGYSYECLRQIQSIEDEIEKMLSETTSFNYKRINGRASKISDLIKKEHDALPKEWKFQVTLSSMSHTNNYLLSTLFKKLLDDFRNTFVTDPKTGIDLVEGLELSTLSLLIDQDRKVLQSFIVNYISQNSNIYKFPVTIKIVDYNSNEDIQKKAIIAKKHVEAMILDVPAFKTKLLEKINLLQQ